MPSCAPTYCIRPFSPVCPLARLLLHNTLTKWLLSPADPADPTSNGVAQQLSKEQDAEEAVKVDLREEQQGNPFTVSDAISGAVQNAKVFCVCACVCVYAVKSSHF